MRYFARLTKNTRCLAICWGKPHEISPFVQICFFSQELFLGGESWAGHLARYMTACVAPGFDLAVALAQGCGSGPKAGFLYRKIGLWCPGWSLVSKGARKGQPGDTYPKGSQKQPLGLTHLEFENRSRATSPQCI